MGSSALRTISRSTRRTRWRTGRARGGLLAFVCEDNRWEYGWEYGFGSAGVISLQLVAALSQAPCSCFRLTTAGSSGSRRTF